MTAHNPQLDDLDPMEIQDQEDVAEEGAELAQVSDGQLNGEEEVEEEDALVKDIDAVVSDTDDTHDHDDDAELDDSDDDDDEGEDEEEATPPTNKPVAAADKPAKKKTGGYLIPRDLIDRALTPEDLFDEGSL